MPRVTSKQAEQAIFERFLTAYSKELGYSLAEVTHRDRRDFEALDPESNERIGIEVAGAYQNDEEAKIQYSVVEEWDVFRGSLDELIPSLNRSLNDKAQKSKSYDYGGRLVLAIWLGSLIFQEKYDVDFIRRQIAIPENCFSDIWLIICGKDGNPELYRLQ